MSMHFIVWGRVVANVILGPEARFSQVLMVSMLFTVPNE